MTDSPVHKLGMNFNHFCFLVFPTGPAGGFVLSPIAFSSLYMMRFENLSSAGTLEVSGFICFAFNNNILITEGA